VLAGWIKERFQVATVRACRLARFSRAGFYRKSTAKDQSALRLRIREIAHARLSTPAEDCAVLAAEDCTPPRISDLLPLIGACA
jgi:hypothetical protein